MDQRVEIQAELSGSIVQGTYGICTPASVGTRFKMFTSDGEGTGLRARRRKLKSHLPILLRVGIDSKGFLKITDCPGVGIYTFLSGDLVAWADVVDHFQLRTTNAPGVREMVYNQFQCTPARHQAACPYDDVPHGLPLVLKGSL